ncbi:MAG: hypothetical protein AAFU78_15395 [Cyanobacteria bacterium J06633_2]
MVTKVQIPHSEYERQRWMGALLCAVVDFKLAVTAKDESAVRDVLLRLEPVDYHVALLTFSFAMLTVEEYFLNNNPTQWSAAEDWVFKVVKEVTPRLISSP